MGVNIALLTKAAKVYDCSEPVEGITPKMQYEEHKKMTPDEFSREHTKESSVEQDFLNKSMIRDISRMMAPQVGANLGGAVGGLAGLIGGGIHGAYNPGAVGELDEEGNARLKRRSRLMGALRGAAGYGLGGLVGGSMLGGMAGRAYGDYKYGGKPWHENQPAKVVPMKKAAAVKEAAMFYDNAPVNQWNAMRTDYTLPKQFGLAGAGLGALTGGLYGASTARKGKRTGAILRGLLGGALTGGAGGLAAGFGVRSAMPEAQPQGIGMDLKAMGRMLQNPNKQEFIDGTYRDIFGKSKQELEDGMSRGALLGGGAGLLGGGLLTGALMPEDTGDDDDDKKKKTASAALSFGEKFAQALLPVMEQSLSR